MNTKRLGTQTIIGALIFLIVFAAIGVWLFSLRTIKLDVSLQGYEIGLNQSVDKEVTLHLNGKVKYKNFKPVSFTGTMLISGHESPFDGGEEINLNFHDGEGMIISRRYISSALESTYRGSVLLSNNLKSFVLVLTDGSGEKYGSFISAPARNTDDAYTLAEKLSQNNIWKDMDWRK